MTKPPRARGGGSPKRAGKQRRYTAAEKAAAVDVFKADGLAAAAKSVGAAKSTVAGWLRAAGIDPVEQSTDEKRRQTAAARAARIEQRTEARNTLSGLLITELGPKAAGMLLKRLDEELTLDEHIKADEERLEDAITSLRVLTEAEGDDSLDQAPEKVKDRKAMRVSAREAVRDCLLILNAHRRGRTAVPELVGVLTRSITDHLNLEKGDAVGDAGVGFTVVLSSNRPARTPPAVVTLDPEPESVAR